TTTEISNSRNQAYQLSDRYINFNSWNDPDFASALNLANQTGNTLACADDLPLRKDLAFWNPYYTNRVVWIEWEEPGDTWYNRLTEAGADYVYVSKDSDADIFADLESEWFSQVYSSINGSFYQILELDEYE
ncbi:hypothetical protein KAU08_01930, partial [bacterium]|nr:hypothetical protein [bacterium]